MPAERAYAWQLLDETRLKTVIVLQQLVPDETSYNLIRMLRNCVSCFKRCFMFIRSNDNLD